jgi:hypothetical protein
MRIVTAQELENWMIRGAVLEADGRGPKVLALDNGLFLKIFHTRRHPWLARLQPAAQRFAENADRLQIKGIATPKVVDVFWLDRQAGLSGCIYQPIPGRSLEWLYHDNPQQFTNQLEPLATFICQLHQRGIYFRSLHLGNIIQLPSGQYGLIDILDLQHKRKALNAWQIKRNFKHLQHYLKRKGLANFPLDRLLKDYRDTQRRT